MAKMYYTQEEAAAKLGVAVEGLADMVRQQKLRAYADGAKRMYKVEEVDALSGGKSDEIELSPMSADSISLSEADAKKPAGKEDTVITAEGISIFDEEDLEIETADPMAKTQIAPSVEDQVLLEGIGSGSGLLDLTRESDDTSLGAEVLEHIDMEGAVGSDLGGGLSEVPPAYAPAAEAPLVQPTYVEAVDASTGLFTGVSLSAMLLTVAVLIGLLVSAYSGVVPGYLDSLSGNVVVLIVVGMVLAAGCGVLGLFVGKSMAAKQAAMKRVGA